MSNKSPKADKEKRKEELLKDLAELRQHIADTKSKETERKHAEEDLKVSGMKYHSLFNKIADPVFIYDKETHKFLDCNEAVLKAYGYSKKELKTMTPFDFYAPEDFKKAKETMVDGKTDAFFTYNHVTKYGQQLSVEVITDEIEYEGQLALISIVRDITDRKKAEDALMKARIELEQRVKERTYQLEEINTQMKQEIMDRRKVEDDLKESFITLRKTLEGIVQAIAIVVEARDPYTAGHQRRVAQLACAIAKQMGFKGEEIEGIRVACLLHDVGKITIPIEILSKPGKLSETEFSFIKKHPVVGYDILKGIEFPWQVATIVHQHHERIDGSGYPKGLSRKDILIESKILSVADVVEAMSSHRPYRPARGIDKALGEILENRGVSYEPDVVNSCLKIFAEKIFEFE